MSFPPFYACNCSDWTNSNFVERYMKARDNAGAEARRPGSKLVHGRGLWSAGPGEEWGGDGHLKLLDEMGISIWGIVDKATRRELGLFAVPGPLKAPVPVALYLLTVKKCGGKYCTTVDSDIFFVYSS